jgi:ZIP family zinc transporter
VIQTVLFAAGASLPLFLGAVLGTAWSPPRKLLATAMAFAAGALISAVAFELFETSYRDGGLARAGLGFAAGAVVFVALDTVLDRFASSGRAVGFALLAGVTIDGIPENTALGVSLVEHGSLALLVAVLVSNLPEGLSGAAKMHQAGTSKAFVLGLWGTATLLLAGAVLAGRWVFASASPEQLAFPLAVAAGAVLASVIDTIAPEAYEEGGPYVALASAAGFVTAFVLSH